MKSYFNGFGINKQGDANWDDDLTPKPLSRFEFTIDLEYWALLPCFNINFHFPEFEFEWLCFGFYFRLDNL